MLLNSHDYFSILTMTRANNGSLSCPMCGYQSLIEDCSTTPPNLERSSISKWEQKQSLSHSILQLEAIMETLSEKLATQRQKLNHLQSTTTIFPPEILSTIFQFVCPPDEYNSTHHKVTMPNGRICSFPVFILCSVSTYWRRVAISTRQLWTKLDLTHKRQPGAVSISLELLKIYSERSPNNLLDLKISTTTKRKKERFYPHPTIPSVRLTELEHAAFIKNATHIQKLTLLGVTYKWMHLVQPLTQLKELRVDLLNLNFHGVDYSLLNFADFPWRDTLTVAHLTGVHIPHCLQVLTECPNLIEFRIHRPVPVLGTPDHCTPHNYLVNLQHLKQFDWESTKLYWDNAVLVHVRLPSLQRLNWNKLDSNGHSHLNPQSLSLFYTNLSQFLSTSSSTLTELEFCFTTITDEDSYNLVPTIIASTPNIRKLALSCRSKSKSISLVTKLLLRPLLMGLDDDNSMIPLPTLEHLHLKIPVAAGLTPLNPQPESTHEEDVANNMVLVEMIKQRRERIPIESFRLDFDFDPPWDADTIRELRGLARGGLALKIVQFSRSVDWL